MPRISGVTGWLAKSTPGEAGLSSPCFLTLGLTDLVLLGFVRVEGFFPPTYLCTISRLPVLTWNKEVHLQGVPYEENFNLIYNTQFSCVYTNFPGNVSTLLDEENGDFFI